MTSVYVVIAETGCYSDRSERAVCAFATDDEAEDFANECESRAMELSQWKCSHGFRRHEHHVSAKRRCDCDEKPVHELDDGWWPGDYPYYYVWTVPFQGPA